MNKRKDNIKQKLQQDLQTIRLNNEDIIRETCLKKKWNNSSICEKKDIHNYINSLLRGSIFSEDLINQFWDYHFRKSALLSDVLRAYNNTILLLLNKIIQNYSKIVQLRKQVNIRKQNHQVKQMNVANQQIQKLQEANTQYDADLEQFCTPFSLNYQKQISRYKQLYQQQKNEQNCEEKKDKDLNLNNLNVHIDFNDEVSQFEVQLTTQQKYYRFLVIVSLVVLFGQLTLSFNKNNFLNLFISVVIAFNALMQNLILSNDQFNKLTKNIEINYIESKIDFGQKFKLSKQLQTDIFSNKVNFDNFSYPTLWLLIVSTVWDVIWLLIMYNAYRYTDNQNILSQYTSNSIWKYNVYIIHTSFILVFLKVLQLYLTFHTIQFKTQKIISRFYLYIPLLRLGGNKLKQAINNFRIN